MSKYKLCGKPLTFGDPDQIRAIKHASLLVTESGKRMLIEFELWDENGEFTLEWNEAKHLGIAIACVRCRQPVSIKKRYEPAPMHYESLLRICEPVRCKCGQVYRHVQDEEDGNDYLEY